MYPCELLDRRDDTCVPYTNKLSSFGCSVQHAHRRTHFDVRYAADERVHAAHTTFTNTKSFGSVASNVSLLPAFVVFRVIRFSLNDSAIHVSQKKRVFALTVFFPRVLNFFRLNSRFTNRISVYFAQIHLTQIKIE